MRLTSPEFDDGSPIPERFTCLGDDVSPPLLVDDVPDQAVSLALVVDDPDAPGGTFDHWLLWNLPTRVTTIPTAIPPHDFVEGLAPTTQGENGFGRIGYGGPCPPPGKPHRYRFHLFALDAILHLNPGSRRDRLEQEIENHVVEEAMLTGTFGRDGGE